IGFTDGSASTAKQSPCPGDCGLCPGPHKGARRRDKQHPLITDPYMAPVDDSSTKQSANGSLAITFLLSCLRLQSEDSTVKQSQRSTGSARPGGHNGQHGALDKLWPSRGRHRGPLPESHRRGRDEKASPL